jgi:hypothetical protein
MLERKELMELQIAILGGNHNPHLSNGAASLSLTRLAIAP